MITQQTSRDIRHQSDGSGCARVTISTTNDTKESRAVTFKASNLFV